MAIVDMKSTVAKDQNTMTGKINETPNTISAPNLSGMNKLFDKKQVAQKPIEDAPVQKAPTAKAPSDDLIAKVQNLTNEDKAVLSAVLSPSVSNVLTKLAPELSSIIEAAGPKEENVIIPVSMFKNFAQKRYSGDETQAVQSLITDMSGTEMEQQTVPPGTQMAELPESGVEGPLNAVDTEGEVV